MRNCVLRIIGIGIDGIDSIGVFKVAIQVKKRKTSAGVSIRGPKPRNASRRRTIAQYAVPQRSEWLG